MAFNIIVRRYICCKSFWRSFTVSSCCEKEKRERKPYSPEELKIYLEHKRRSIDKHLNYLGQVYYVVDRFTEEIEKQAAARRDVEGMQYKLIEHERKLREEALAVIAKDNEEMAKKRALRLEKEKEEEAKFHAEKNMERLQAELDDIEYKRSLVLKAIEESKDWITPENLDEKISEALDTEVNYNFALTPSGEKIYSIVPPGNFGPDWKSPGPSAYALGGFKPGEGEWDFVFRRQEMTNEQIEKDQNKEEISNQNSSQS